ncbi:MAG: EamA family transporter [Alphaproteobacteria bacterium]|nr:EamA family transporter [Alphaproteobacteria bacterium]
MSPDLLAAILALVAAGLHATWNAMIKVRGDRLIAMTILSVAGGLCSVPLIVFGGPIDLRSLPFLLGSVFVHTFYYAALIASYRAADLSHAYPLARGSAPLLLTLAAPLWLGETITTPEALGIAMISCGIFALLRLPGGLVANWRMAAYPLATGITIATYTVFDTLGVRASGNPPAYVGWLFFLDTFPILLFVVVRHPMALIATLRTGPWLPALGGVISALGYGMVLVAISFGQAEHVAALRETSVILAALIGTRLLGEPFGPRRVFAAALVAAGAVVLEVGG